jgi:hypothetical protein
MDLVEQTVVVELSGEIAAAHDPHIHTPPAAWTIA